MTIRNASGHTAVTFVGRDVLRLTKVGSEASSA
jgi:hypothetical protein